MGVEVLRWAVLEELLIARPSYRWEVEVEAGLSHSLEPTRQGNAESLCKERW